MADTDRDTDPTTVGPEYQGWTNRETWAASLHLSNDQYLYTGARAAVQNALHVAGEDAGLYTGANALEEWVTAEVEYDRGQLDNGNDGSAVITMMDREVGSWWRVNWREVADGLMDA
jgi:hypothetical protein